MQARALACGYRSASEYIETLIRLDRDVDLRVTVVRDKNGSRHFAEALNNPTPDSSTIPKRKNGNGGRKSARKKAK